MSFTQRRKPEIMTITRWLRSVIYTGKTTKGYKFCDKEPEKKMSLGRMQHMQKLKLYRANVEKMVIPY